MKKQHEDEKNNVTKILADARKKENEQEEKAIKGLEKIKMDMEKRVKMIEVCVCVCV
jgi:hypothetical protein